MKRLVEQQHKSPMAVDDAISLYRLIRQMVKPCSSTACSWVNFNKNYAMFVASFIKALMMKYNVADKELIKGVAKSNNLERVIKDMMGFIDFGEAYIDIYSYNSKGIFEQAGILMTEIFGPMKFYECLVYNNCKSLLDACDYIDKQVADIDLSDFSDDDSDEDYEDDEEINPDEEWALEAYYGVSEKEAWKYAKLFADDLRKVLSGEIDVEDIGNTELSGFYDCMCLIMKVYEVRKDLFVKELYSLLRFFFGGCNIDIRSRLNVIKGIVELPTKNRNELFCDYYDNDRIIVKNIPLVDMGHACPTYVVWYLDDYGHVFDIAKKKEELSEISEIEEAFLWACDSVCTARYMTESCLMDLSTAISEGNRLVFRRLDYEETDGSHGNVQKIGPSIAEMLAPLLVVTLGNHLKEQYN